MSILRTVQTIFQQIVSHPTNTKDFTYVSLK